MLELDEELLEAARKNLSHVIELMIKGGANPNVMSGASWVDYGMEGFTPLMVAARNNSVVCLLTLLDFGADVNYKHPRLKSSALNQAVRMGNIDCTRVLLERGANVCRMDLTDACQDIFHGKFEVVRMLVEAGCDINARDRNGDTPLIMTVKANYEECVVDAEYLLKNGAIVGISNARGVTAMDFALSVGNSDMVMILEKYNAMQIHDKPRKIKHDTSFFGSLFGFFR